jgi:hypothetical protein
MLCARLTLLKSRRNVDLLIDLSLLGHEVIRRNGALRGAKAGSSKMRQNGNLFLCINRDIETKTLQKPNVSIPLSKNTKARERKKILRA